MTRWKITIEYDGTPFCGWQKQDNVLSVQQSIEEAVQQFSGEQASVLAAGRTDTGVHARAQVAHFDLHKETKPEVIRDALNYYLRLIPISILNVEQVDEAFHARFSALGRSYRYRIINRRAPLAIGKGYAWHVSRHLDEALMQQAANSLLGTHDFSTFRAQNCQSKSPIKTLDQLDVIRDGEEITIHTAARSFLYHQVRNMVGTLTMVGNGKWSLDDFRAAFAAQDRAKGGPTAPPQGLCFWGVSYPQK